MKSKFLASCFIACAVCSATAFGQQLVSDSSLDILQGQESISHQQLALIIAPVKSSIDLNGYLLTTPAKSSPLSKLTQRAQQRFIDNLTFNEKGLTGLNYADLEAELSVSEIYQVLALFGKQHLVTHMKRARMLNAIDRAIIATNVSNIAKQKTEFAQLQSFDQNSDETDYPDMACTGRATCSRSIGSICIGSNC